MRKNKNKIKNPHWRKRWLKVVKYDQDWDWQYFMEIILHKLYLVKLRWSDGEMSVCQEDRIKMVDRLDRLYRLGCLINAETTEEWAEADRILEKYGKHVTTKVVVNGKEAMSWKLEWEPKDGDPDYWKNECYRLSLAGDARHKKNVEEFFAELGEIMLELWD